MKTVVLGGLGLIGAYWLLSKLRQNQSANVAEQPMKFSYEEQQKFQAYLIDILKKDSLPLTVSRMIRSLKNFFSLQSPEGTLAFVNSFVKQWNGYLIKTTLNGEVAYRWM